MSKEADGKVMIVACVCIMIVECFALYKGIDGVYLGLTLTVLGGIAGYVTRDVIRTRGDKSERR